MSLEVGIKSLLPLSSEPLLCNHSNAVQNYSLHGFILWVLVCMYVCMYVASRKHFAFGLLKILCVFFIDLSG